MHEEVTKAWADFFETMETAETFEIEELDAKAKALISLVEETGVKITINTDKQTKEHLSEWFDDLSQKIGKNLILIANVMLSSEKPTYLEYSLMVSDLEYSMTQVKLLQLFRETIIEEE